MMSRPPSSRTLVVPRPDRASFARRLAAVLTASLLAAALVSRLGAQPSAIPTSGARSARVAPGPQLSPDDVVSTVLDALARNDTPTRDRGIETTFTFSSPANRAAVGPFERFASMVRADTYRPLLYHLRAVRGPARVVGDRATQRVTVLAASGAQVVYTFTLSRQADGPCSGCWMTDSVLREPPSAITPPRYADATTRVPRPISRGEPAR